jgi:hypothetical protein
VELDAGQAELLREGSDGLVEAFDMTKRDSDRYGCLLRAAAYPA